MPIDLSDVRKRVKVLEVDLDGDKLRLEYYPGESTPATYADLLAKEEEAQPHEAAVFLRNAICRLVAKWDLLSEPGKPLPLKPEALVVVPVRYLVAIWRAIDADLAPNPTSFGPSPSI
jgi:hypothetical protein